MRWKQVRENDVKIVTKFLLFPTYFRKDGEWRWLERVTAKMRYAKVLVYDDLSYELAWIYDEVIE